MYVETQSTANAGKRAIELLLRDLDTENGFSTSNKLSEDDIQKLGGRLAGYLVGTRDARTMPAWIIHDNEI